MHLRFHCSLRERFPIGVRSGTAPTSATVPGTLEPRRVVSTRHPRAGKDFRSAWVRSPIQEVRSWLDVVISRAESERHCEEEFYLSNPTGSILMLQMNGVTDHRRRREGRRIFTRLIRP